MQNPSLVTLKELSTEDWSQRYRDTFVRYDGKVGYVQAIAGRGLFLLSYKGPLGIPAPVPRVRARQLINTEDWSDNRADLNLRNNPPRIVNRAATGFPIHERRRYQLHPISSTYQNIAEYYNGILYYHGRYSWMQQNLTEGQITTLSQKLQRYLSPDESHLYYYVYTMNSENINNLERTASRNNFSMFSQDPRGFILTEDTETVRRNVITTFFVNYVAAFCGRWVETLRDLFGEYQRNGYYIYTDRSLLFWVPATQISRGDSLWLDHIPVASEENPTMARLQTMAEEEISLADDRPDDEDREETSDEPQMVEVDVAKLDLTRPASRWFVSKGKPNFLAYMTKKQYKRGISHSNTYFYTMTKDQVIKPLSLTSIEKAIVTLEDAYNIPEFNPYRRTTTQLKEDLAKHNFSLLSDDILITGKDEAVWFRNRKIGTVRDGEFALLTSAFIPEINELIYNPKILPPSRNYYGKHPDYL